MSNVLLSAFVVLLVGQSGLSIVPLSRHARAYQAYREALDSRTREEVDLEVIIRMDDPARALERLRRAETAANRFFAAREQFYAALKQIGFVGKALGSNWNDVEVSRSMDADLRWLGQRDRELRAALKGAESESRQLIEADLARRELDVITQLRLNLLEQQATGRHDTAAFDALSRDAERLSAQITEIEIIARTERSLWSKYYAQLRALVKGRDSRR